MSSFKIGQTPDDKRAPSILTPSVTAISIYTIKRMLSYQIHKPVPRTQLLNASRDYSFCPIPSSVEFHVALFDASSAMELAIHAQLGLRQPFSTPDDKFDDEEDNDHGCGQRRYVSGYSARSSNAGVQERVHVESLCGLGQVCKSTVCSQDDDDPEQVHEWRWACPWEDDLEECEQRVHGMLTDVTPCRKFCCVPDSWK